METLEILSPGPLATVQDRGRLEWLHLGVPTSGAMDPTALRLGNWLVGNPESAAAIEITLGGFTGRFLRESFFAVTGPSGRVWLNAAPLPLWQAHRAAGGDTLTIEAPECGVRSILALSGGIDVPVVLGSRSTYLRGCFGGFSGRALRPGDVLSVYPLGAEMIRRAAPERLIPRYGRSVCLRVVPGPQAERFSPAGWQSFCTSEYRVSERTDRMGCLLEGPAVAHTCGADILSDGLAWGAVQVPGNGQPIILLADRPTTGGYTKIATVIGPDLPLAGQLGLGASVRFEAISLIEAREIHLKAEFALRRLGSEAR